MRADDIDNPVYQRIAGVYQSDEVRALFDTVYAGVYLPAWEAADEADGRGDRSCGMKRRTKPKPRSPRRNNAFPSHLLKNGPGPRVINLAAGAISVVHSQL